MQANVFCTCIQSKLSLADDPHENYSYIPKEVKLLTTITIWEETNTPFQAHNSRNFLEQLGAKPAYTITMVGQKPYFAM